MYIGHDEDRPIILRNPFLSTTHALVYIHNSKLTLRVGDEEVTFGVKAKSIHSDSNKDVFFMEDIDKWGQDNEEENEHMELEKMMEEEMMNMCEVVEEEDV